MGSCGNGSHGRKRPLERVGAELCTEGCAEQTTSSTNQHKKGQDLVTACSSSNNHRMASLKGLPESRTCRKGLQPLDASCNRQLSCLTAHVGVGFLFCSIRLYQMKGKNLF